MGYNYHITRASRWTESESSPICLAEWQAFVVGHPDFQWKHSTEVTSPHGADQSECPSSDQVRESWRSLQRHYQTQAAAVDYRFQYIVDRLIDSEVAERFTIGEAFQLPWHQGDDTLDMTAPYSRSAGRALYFTLARYGVALADTPHVAMYFSVSQLMATYCRGTEVVITHVCQLRKEIPCLLSLLDMLWRDRGLPSPRPWRDVVEGSRRSPSKPKAES